MLINAAASQVVGGLLNMLGAGGAFVLMSATFDVDDRVRVHFGLPTDPPSDILCEAELRYVLEGRGVGVQFLDLDPEQHASLKAFIHKKLTDTTSVDWDEEDAAARKR